MRKQMVPAHDPAGGAAADQADARQKLKDELVELDERLRAMVDAYEEKQSAIDSGVLATDSAVDVEATIIDVYRVMKTRVYGEDSPLRADHDVWEAFKEQKDEFIGFYKSALKALEVYRDVLRSYSLVRGESMPRPQRGDLEPIRQDKRAQVNEREACIQAISDFHGKFSAMLTVL